MTFTIANIILAEPGNHNNVSKYDDKKTIFLKVHKKEDLSLSLSQYNNLKCVELSMHIDQITNLFDPLSIATLVNSLQDDSGSLFKITVLPSTTTTTQDDTTTAAVFNTIRTSFLLAGLEMMHTESEEKKNDDDNNNHLPKVFTAKKINTYNNVASATASIQIPKNKINSNGNGVVRLNTKIMLSGLDDIDNDDDDLIDEDNLLLDNNVILPPTATASTNRRQDDDCGGRKACDDCTCGRAELEQMEASAATAAPSTSSCGNCSKGDAFRCGGCPYLGKPAFKAGEEMLYLDLTDDL